jgi:hypothetical protein
MAQNIFLRKTPKEDLEKNPKLPYFELVLIQEAADGGETKWYKIGALWKAKSGNGYSGRLEDVAHVDYDHAAADQARANWKANKEQAED